MNFRLAGNPLGSSSSICVCSSIHGYSIASLRRRALFGSPSLGKEDKSGALVMRRILILSIVLCFALRAFGEDAPSGLRLRLSAGGETAVVVVPNVQMYVPDEGSGSPFIPVGRTDAEWTGYVNVDLRGDYRFKAQANGILEIKINGKVVLSGEGDGAKELGPSEEVRLNKGANKLRVTLRGPEKGAAFVRLLWSEYGFLWEPIHRSYLFRDADDPALVSMREKLLGRELFLEGRCVRCHESKGSDGLPELDMDAPRFAGIGSRRNEDWMAKWILNPKKERPTARMPVMLHRETAPEDAAAIAAFLGSLKDEDQGISGATEEEADWLVELYHCVGCHVMPGGGDDEPGKISLEHLNRKFPAGHLAAFLMEPTKHYKWRRMPDFGMSKEEALALAVHLRSKASPAKEADADTSTLVSRGKELVQTSGCLNCHALELPNRFVRKQLSELLGSARGCLSATKLAGVPFFSLDDSQRKALQVFIGTDHKSLYRHVAAEFAERQTRQLRCTACHGELVGFPPLERLGGKLRPEFMAELLGGKIEDSPRPWLEHVMPAFPAYAAGLAAGLAHSHGYPEVTPKEGPIDIEAAKIGRKLTGVNGGFSCVSCHGIGDLQPAQVFEAEGINLALPARRLQKDYFIRWLLNPMKIDPQTKMPVYFDEEGYSPLFDVYEGDAMKQLEAFWQYMRMGEDIDPPKMEGF